MPDVSFWSISTHKSTDYLVFTAGRPKASTYFKFCFMKIAHCLTCMYYTMTLILASFKTALYAQKLFVLQIMKEQLNGVGCYNY